MATLIENWSTIEVRGIVRRLLANGKKLTEIHKEIIGTYSENAMSKKQVYHWCSLFKGGRTSLEDDPRTSRPLSSASDENIDSIDELIRKDRCIKIRGMATIPKILPSTVHGIVHSKLRFQKVSVR